MHKLRERGERRPPFRGKRAGDEEAMGFVFRKFTIDALSSIDLSELATRPAPRVLVVPRDDLPGGEARVADRFLALGAEVDVRHAPGYAASTSDDPYVAEVPTAIWSEVVAWLEQTFPAQSRVSRSIATRGAPETIDERVVETALRFGDGARFFGILSEPRAARSDVAVIVPNTGANPRVGTNRFNVAVARRLAARGHAVLRMDLGGIGDTPADGHAENDLFADRSIAEVRSAIDLAAERGYRRFVTMGLCSGAYVSFHAGLADERIRAIVMMNPSAFEWTPGRKVERIATRGHGSVRSTRYYKGRALRAETWRRLLRGEVHAGQIGRVLVRRVRDRATTTVKRAALRFGRGGWVMSDLAEQFGALVQRDARVLLLFSGEEAMLDELDKKLGGLMTWLESRGVELEVIDDTDHIFAPVWSQERASDLLTAFVDRVAREK
jgi:hypothetical protein